MKYKCIIFDCDGVLVDSETATIGVLVDMAKQVGLSLKLERALALFAGQSLQYCFDCINANATKPLPSNAVTIFREKARKAYLCGIQAIPNIEILLKQLKIPICVASNGPLDKIKSNLELVKLISYFDDKIYSAYQIEKWKPLPDLFLYAAAKMGFLPSECLVVEDSLAGVQAAIAGGFDVLAYANADRAERLQKAGATTFDDMGKLYDLLQNSPT